MIRKVVKIIRMTKVSGTDKIHHQVVNAEPDISRERWIQKYSPRLLSHRMHWKTPLGVASAYSEQIEKDLAKFYDELCKEYSSKQLISYIPVLV